MKNTDKRTLNSEELGTITGGEKIINQHPIINNTEYRLPTREELEFLQKIKKIIPNMPRPDRRDPTIVPLGPGYQKQSLF